MSQLFCLQFPRFHFSNTGEMVVQMKITDIDFTVKEERDLESDNNTILVIDNPNVGKMDVTTPSTSDKENQKKFDAIANANGTGNGNGNPPSKTSGAVAAAKEMLNELQDMANMDSPKSQKTNDLIPGAILHKVNGIKTENFVASWLPMIDIIATHTSDANWNKEAISKSRFDEKWQALINYFKTTHEAMANRHEITNDSDDDEKKNEKIELGNKDTSNSTFNKHYAALVAFLDENFIGLTFHRPQREIKIGKPVGLSYVAMDELKQSESIKTIHKSSTAHTARFYDTSVGNLSTHHVNDEAAFIDDSQIGASTQQESDDNNFIASACRLNNPNGCWMPSVADQNTLDTWIRVDLGSKHVITGIDIQPHPFEQYWIDAFWIDYSDDCSSWQTHGTGEINTNFHSKKKPLSSLSSVISTNQEHLQIIGGATTSATTTSKLPNATSNETTRSHSNSDGANVYVCDNNEISSHNIWPFIHARFIRLRPFKVYQKVALRFELYTLSDTESEEMVYNSRAIQPVNMNARERALCFKTIENLSRYTFVTQLDCRRWVQSALLKAQISNCGFMKQDQDSYFCFFSTEDGLAGERVLNELAKIGFGFDFGTMTISPIDLRRPQRDRTAIVSDDETNFFAKSIKTKQLITQLTLKIQEAAEFTFDFVMMLIVASCIAGGGLATDNAVIVVASMLVSPLMGPVLSFSFGTHLKDYKMFRLGLRNECMSLVICVICGILIGIPYAYGAEKRYDWPTGQMAARGDATGLADGAFIAFVSGIGVAVSVLEGYTSTVVGVAISASLLPPAVNCGMLLTYAFYVANGMIEDPINGETTQDLFEMSLYSLLLTIENIIIIYLVALATFRVKTLIPIYVRKSGDRKGNLLWNTMARMKNTNDDAIYDPETELIQQGELHHETPTMPHANSSMYETFSWADGPPLNSDNSVNKQNFSRTSGLGAHGNKHMRKSFYKRDKKLRHRNNENNKNEGNRNDGHGHGDGDNNNNNNNNNKKDYGNRMRPSGFVDQLDQFADFRSGTMHNKWEAANWGTLKNTHSYNKTISMDQRQQSERKPNINEIFAAYGATPEEDENDDMDDEKDAQKKNVTFSTAVNDNNNNSSNNNNNNNVDTIVDVANDQTAVDAEKLDHDAEIVAQEVNQDAKLKNEIATEMMNVVDPST